jgi:fermentation-respiration switch protein FrsA (DUF1100 family)
LSTSTSLIFGGPLLISHGDADTTISLEHGQRLYRAANEPKEFVQIANGKHNDPQSEEFREALDRLLEGTTKAVK